MLLGIPVRIGERITMLDQEPFVLGFAALDAHKNEAAVQFFAQELEFEVALGELLVHAVGAFGLIRTFIPHNDFAATVLAFRNRAFKLTVIVWMIFHLNREPLVARIHRRTFWHRP